MVNHCVMLMSATVHVVVAYESNIVGMKNVCVYQNPVISTIPNITIRLGCSTL